MSDKKVKAYRGPHVGNGNYLWYRTDGGESYIRKGGEPHPWEAEPLNPNTNG